MDKELQDYILQTLSFFKPMNKEQIIFDFDMKKLERFKNFDMDQLDSFLAQLVVKKKLKKLIVNREISYIKINQANRSVLQKIRSYLNL